MELNITCDIIWIESKKHTISYYYKTTLYNMLSSNVSIVHVVNVSMLLKSCGISVFIVKIEMIAVDVSIVRVGKSKTHGFYNIYIEANNIELKEKAIQDINF